ncbi:MAG: 16S rRNA (uracil(1498)-N(3))-methyltransferase [Porticoccaceae bacterium]
MNLLLLEPADFIGANRARIGGRRFAHLQGILRLGVGETLRAGVIDGKLGLARILTLTAESAELDVAFDQPPPPALPVTLVLALPRPKMLRRILQTTTAMGVKKLLLINSYRVEKSYWQSPWLAPATIREQLLLGLEQAGDTRLPVIELRHRFKPFVEDELAAVAAGSLALVAHPSADQAAPVAWNQPATLAIGPEGGFIPYEIAALIGAGFTPVSLGARILRVEIAVPALLGRLFS